MKQYPAQPDDKDDSPRPGDEGGIMSERNIGRLRPRFSARKSLRLTLVLFLPLWVQFARGPDVQARGRRQSPAQSPQQSAGEQATQEAVTLELGKSVERELSGGQKQTYRLALTQGQYAKVTVEQRGADVVARVFAAGELIADVDSEGTARGAEEIELVAGPPR